MGGNCEKCFQSLHIVLSHHLKSCRYLQQSIDLPSLLEGPKLYRVLIDYVDSLCRVWMSCLCHDIRPWQQSYLLTWRELLLWISKRASGLPYVNTQMHCDFGEMAEGRHCISSIWLKIPILTQKAFKVTPNTLFPFCNAGVDASLRGETGLGSKVNCTVTLWWVLRLYFPVTLLLHRLT